MVCTFTVVMLTSQHGTESLILCLGKYNTHTHNTICKLSINKQSTCISFDLCLHFLSSLQKSSHKKSHEAFGHSIGNEEVTSVKTVSKQVTYFRKSSQK